MGAEDVSGHAVTDHEDVLGLEATTTECFLIETDVGFIIADIHGDISIFEERENTCVFKSGALEMTKTIGSRKESVTLGMEGLECFSGIGNESVGLAPRSPESMFEWFDGLFAETCSETKLSGVQIHYFWNSMESVLGFGEETTAYFEEEVEETAFG